MKKRQLYTDPGILGKADPRRGVLCTAGSPGQWKRVCQGEARKAKKSKAGLGTHKPFGFIAKDTLAIGPSHSNTSGELHHPSRRHTGGFSAKEPSALHTFANFVLFGQRMF